MKLTVKSTLFLVISLLMVLSMNGCNNPKQIGSTYEEPEITIEYLSTAYVDQLIRDGGTHFFGSIEITSDENGNPYIIIAEKELVADKTQPKGYYIADKNLESTYPLSFEARTTHLTGETSIANIMTSENFVKAVVSDKKSIIQKPTDESLLKYYDIYVIGDQVELILAHYLN
ncbi:MAG: hypothetical protein JJE49_01595 [Peptostreptococcaceae bacterium]|nr:hypothetical protein [Peptostreptococcaceae bacterium]